MLGDLPDRRLAQFPSMSFGGVATEYERLRPRLSEDVTRWLWPQAVDHALDLAAGTGQASRSLLNRAAKVTLIEPDPEMRAVLQSRLPRMNILSGTAERLPLRDASVDAVMVSNAWHWFDGSVAAGEIARILRAGGVLGIVWNGPDRAVTPTAEVSHVMCRGLEGEGLATRRTPDIARSSGLRLAGQREFVSRRTMISADLVALLATYSGLLVLHPGERQTRIEAGLTVVQETLGYGADARIEVPHVAVAWRYVREARRAKSAGSSRIANTSDAEI